MLTNLKTYEGVPIGGSNFEDFLGYVRAFLGANFGFSTNVLVNDGGFFAADEFQYFERSTGGGAAYFFTPISSVEVGNLFGKKGTEYYRFEVLTADGVEPQVHEWELLPTLTSTIETNFTYENTSFDSKILPYRPIKGNSSGYSYGYNEIRFNGIPQNASGLDAGFSLDTSSAAFANQTLTISKLTLGAEYPKPVKNGRYDTVLSSGSVTRTTLQSDYNNRVKFPYTNFSIDFGGHIVLHRTTSGGDELYEYIPQDTSSGEEVPVGFYKVIDYARGEIELNISTTQAEQIIGEDSFTADTVPFYILSLEQLQEDTEADITSYHTRYGEIYDGDDSQVELLEYIFDGQNHVIRSIPSADYVSTEGDVLLQDTTQQYSDGIVLARKYRGNVNKQRLTAAQFNRYEPDTFQLYYYTGILKSEVGGTGNIRAFVEQNPESWYNRSVLDAEYYPVSRVESTFVSYITDTEAGSADFSDQITFNPNVEFAIVDTIGLKDLNDVEDPGIDGEYDDNTILKYDLTSSTFLSVPHVLNEINDVSVGTATSGQVLAFNGTTWVSQNLTTGVLGYTPLAREGGTQTDYTVATGQRLYYNQSLAAPASSAGGSVSDALGDLVITPTGYVKGAVNNHNNRDDAHGAVSTATANKIVRRDSNGRALVTAPSTDSSDQIATANWVFNTKAKVTPDISTLIKRDTDGTARVVTPSVGENSTKIASTAWVQSMSTSSNTASRIVIRDSNGRAEIEPPLAGSPVNTIATKGYVDSSLSAGGASATITNSGNPGNQSRTSSLERSGYIHFGSGIVMQWVAPTTATISETSYSANWPLSFTNLYTVQVTTINGDGDGRYADRMMQIWSASNTSVSVYCQNMPNASDGVISGIVYGWGYISSLA